MKLTEESMKLMAKVAHMIELKDELLKIATSELTKGEVRKLKKRKKWN